MMMMMSSSSSVWWSQFHGNAERTGRCEVEGPRTNPGIVWKAEVGCHHWGPGCWVPGFEGTDSSPAVSPSGALVYIGSYDHYLYAVSSENGTIVWKAYTGESGIGIESSPAVSSQNIVVVGTYAKTVVAFNGSDGTSLWNYTTSDYVASAPAIHNETVYIGGVDGYLHSIDVSTGKRKWAFSANKQAVWAPPMVSNHVVCFGSGGEANPYADDHAHVFCVHESSGNQLWNYSIGSSQVQSCPTLNSRNDTLYVGVYDGRLLALDFDTGELKWATKKTGGRVESSPITIKIFEKEIVVVGSFDGNLYAWNADSGEFMWKTSLGKEVGSSPATDRSGVIYIGGDPGVYAINSTNGKIIWHFNGASPKLVGSSPALLSDGSLVVGGEDGWLYKLS